MLHYRIQQQLSAYLDDELSSRQRRRVEQHLSTCEACSMLLLELQEMSESLASLRQTAPEDLWFAINARLEGISSESRTGQRWTWKWIYPIMKPVVAAIGIALIVGAILIQIFPNKPLETSPEYTQMDIYLTAHTQYYSQKMLTSDAVIDWEEQNADTESTQQEKQINDNSEIDFYLSVYLGENGI